MKNGTGSRRAVLKENGLVVEAEVTDLDRVGLASQRITVRREESAPPPELGEPWHLQGQVRHIPERLHYLREPLAPVEYDERVQGATLRSSPPSEDEDGRRFFELRLWKGREVDVTRWYTQKNSNWRKPADFPLTYDVFTQLVDDLADVISE